MCWNDLGVMVRAMRRYASRWSRASSFAAFLLVGCATERGGMGPEARTVAQVSVGEGPDTLTVGDRRSYPAVLRDASGARLPDRPVQYAVSPSAVATVTAAGVVTAVAPGTATLTATAEGTSGSRTLIIQPLIIARLDWTTAPADPVTIEVGANTTRLAVVRDVRGNIPAEVRATYVSSAPNIATVDSLGTVRGVAPGEAVIIARADTATARYTVRVITLSAALFPRQITTEPGMIGQMWAVLRDQEGRRVQATSAQFRSSDPAVIQVSGTGEVEARGVGTATLTVTLNGRVTATTPVVVHPAPTNTLTITPIFEPTVPDYLRRAAVWASRRASRFVLPGASWTPSARDIDAATRCFPNQTVRADSTLWGQVQVMVTMVQNVSATAFGGFCIVRGSRGLTTVEGFPAVTSVLFSAPAAADIVTRLPDTLSTMIFEKVMLHEILHGLGFIDGYFENRGVVPEPTTAIQTPVLLTEAANMGYPPGPLQLNDDRSHWSDLMVLDVISLTAGNTNRARLSVLTLAALQGLGFPVNLRAADITTAAELAGGALGEGPFGPVSPLAPNFTPSAILAGFRAPGAVLLQGDVRHPPQH